MKTHTVSYAIIFLANFYTSGRIFGLGWSVGPASFAKEFQLVALITIIAGIIAAIPKKVQLKELALWSTVFPGLICILMMQGIITNRAFHLLYWALLPIGGAIISMLMFVLTKKLLNRS